MISKKKDQIINGNFMPTECLSNRPIQRTVGAKSLIYTYLIIMFSQLLASRISIITSRSYFSGSCRKVEKCYYPVLKEVSESKNVLQPNSLQAYIFK